MTETQLQLERLRTLQESYHDLADKIDNIQPPEIDATGLAKQGNNPEATNSEILNMLLQMPSQLIDTLRTTITLPVYYDGAVSSEPITSILTAIMHRDKITELTDKISVELPAWKSIGLDNVETLTLSKVKRLPRAAFFGSKITKLYLPSLSYYDAGSTQIFRDCQFRKLSIPLATGFAGNLEFNSSYLIDLEIGAAFNGSQDFGGDSYGWNPDVAMSETDTSMIEDEVDELGREIDCNLKQLLYNIRRHFAANLPELKNGEGYYISIGKVKYAIMEDEPTYSAFTNKGWTIA